MSQREESLQVDMGDGRVVDYSFAQAARALGVSEDFVRRRATEEWRPVSEFAHYSISNQGRVMSRFRPNAPRLLSTFPNSGGYPCVHLWRDGRRHTIAVHRLVTRQFLGPRPEGLVTRHRDGNKWNNTVANLVYGTQSENVIDMVAHGQHHKASNTHCSEGHPFDEANTRKRSRDGARVCRACQRIKANARRRALGIPERPRHAPT